MLVEKRVSAVDSLKEIVVFLAALTFTNAISTVLLDEQTKQIRPWSEVHGEDWFCFLVLIFGVVRFYHGNVRLLDDNYKSGVHRGGILRSTRRNIIWLDFIAVLLIALIFSVLRFFIRDFSYFVCTYTVIIVLDIIWLYFTSLEVFARWSSRGISFKTAGLGWFYNNLLFLALLVLSVLVCYAVTAIIDSGHVDNITGAIRSMKLSEVRLLYWAIVGAILLNCFIDFISSRELYFPSLPSGASSASTAFQTAKRVFLAAPFTQVLAPDGSGIGDFQTTLESLIELFDRNHIEVFNAHQREGWGKALQPPAKALGYDLDEIARSDVLVMIVGTPPSPGVQLELGYAIALKKPVLLLLKKNEFVPYLLRGLNEVVTAEQIVYQQESEIVDKLRVRLNLR
jgi:nucleoside 2-deoxyribosyltransferase